jgi:hypothetical protein
LHPEAVEGFVEHADALQMLDPVGAVEGKAADKTVPINRFTVRSFLTNLTDGAEVKAGRTPASRSRRRVCRARGCSPNA